MSTVTVPNLKFVGRYYPDFVRLIRLFNRTEVPEITSESAEEPFIQQERTFALAMHFCSVLADAVANEMLLPTAKLRDSLRLILKLIDYTLGDYTPATVDLLLELTGALPVSTEITEDNSSFETVSTADEEAVPFEIEDGLTRGPSDVVDAAYVALFDRDGVDGATVLGQNDVLESASAAFTSADLKKLLNIINSTVGNNITCIISEIISSTRVRLEPFAGGPRPNFVVEIGLIWEIRGWSADGAAAVGAPGVPIWSPWPPGVVASADLLLVCSKWVLWDKLSIAFDSVGANIVGVWECYNPSRTSTPTSIINLGTQLLLDIDPLLGTPAAAGAEVTVTYLPTMTSETQISTYDALLGGNIVRTSGFLGQSGTPSTDVNDYSLSAQWIPLQDGYTDGTANLTVDGDVDFDVPQNTEDNWEKATIQTVEGYWLRYRVISVTPAPTSPEFDTIEIDGGTQYLLEEAVQGRAVVSEAAWSSTGLAHQEHLLSRYPAIRDSVRLYVDEGGGEVEWTRMNSILSATAHDRVFRVELDASNKATVRTGDGTNGRIPPLGVENMRATYRVNAEQNGNVGADTVVVDATGVSAIASVTNPRAATGWIEAEGISEESKAAVKRTAPATLTTLNRACTAQDYPTLATRWRNASGEQVVVRAHVIEESYGPKTIEVVCVGAEGNQITGDDKLALENYFNGNEEAREEGVGMANIEATVSNYTPELQGVTVAVTVTDSVTQLQLETLLGTVLDPLAMESNGQTYIWKFGGWVYTSKLMSAIFALSPAKIRRISLTSPATDVLLGKRSLPLLDRTALTVTVLTEG